MELACSTTLTPAYNPDLLQAVLPELPLQPVLVFIVCGGFKASIEDMVDYRRLLLGEEMFGEADWEILK